ncbi:MAG: YraN family protein [Planctomycetales bacterium]|nr:YraN family protein [Planctomycetales bacterium]
MLLPWVRKKLLATPARLGRWGQDQAERHLKRRGCRTLTRNYSCGGGEVDLVMTEADGTLVFIEVKTRRNEDFLPAMAAVTQEKKRKIIRTAKRFLKQFRISDRPLRFDIVTVVLGAKGPPDIRHYPNAFY